MKPSGKAIAKETMAASSPSLDSSVETDRTCAKSLRWPIDSSRRSRESPESRLIELSSKSMPMLRFTYLNNSAIDRSTVNTETLTGGLVRQRPSLQLIDAGERRDVGVSVRSLDRNIE